MNEECTILMTWILKVVGCKIFKCDMKIWGSFFAECAMEQLKYNIHVHVHVVLYSKITIFVDIIYNIMQLGVSFQF